MAKRKRPEQHQTEHARKKSKPNIRAVPLSDDVFKYMLEFVNMKNGYLHLRLVSKTIFQWVHELPDKHYNDFAKYLTMENNCIAKECIRYLAIKYLYHPKLPEPYYTTLANILQTTHNDTTITAALLAYTPIASKGIDMLNISGTFNQNMFVYGGHSIMSKITRINMMCIIGSWQSRFKKLTNLKEVVMFEPLSEFDQTPERFQFKKSSVSVCISETVHTMPILKSILFALEHLGTITIAYKNLAYVDEAIENFSKLVQPHSQFFCTSIRRNTTHFIWCLEYTRKTLQSQDSRIVFEQVVKRGRGDEARIKRMEQEAKKWIQTNK